MPIRVYGIRAIPTTTGRRRLVESRMLRETVLRKWGIINGGYLNDTGRWIKPVTSVDQRSGMEYTMTVGLARVKDRLGT